MDFVSEFHWRPTIGDPSFMGWFTVVAYAVAAGLAVSAGLSQPDDGGELEAGGRRLWLAVAALMAFLCVNKQLDLQTLFTEIGRVIARHQGWYEQRRIFQKWFVLAVLAGSGSGGCWFAWRYWAFWMNHKLLMAGLQFLLTFIVVRAISFHHFDVFIMSRVVGVKVNWALELTGIFLVGMAAARKRRETRLNSKLRP